MTIHFGDNTSIDSGGSLGKILQVVATNVTATSSGTITSGGLNDTPASVTITSTATNSKFVISGSIGGEGSINDYQIAFIFRRVIGGSETSINVGDGSGNRSQITAIMPSGYFNSNQATTPSTTVLSPYLDSPNQASGTAITYKISVSGMGNGGTFYYGRTKDDTNQTSSERLPCHITVMEVAA